MKHLFQAKNYSLGGVKDKLRVFLALNTLLVKSTFSSNPTELVKVRLLGYAVEGICYDSLLILFREMFIEKQYFFKADNNSPFIIDGGSNIGMSILFFKMVYPESRIIGFEPNPKIFQILQRNINNNNLRNVELHNCALTDSNQSIDFHFDLSGSLVGSTFEQRGGGVKTTVTGLLLSDFIDEPEKVDFIKLDIEGGEISVVNDLVVKNKLRGIRQLAIEYHHNMKGIDHSLSDFLNVFESNGFSYNVSASDTPRNGKFQDILVRLYGTNSKLNTNS